MDGWHRRARGRPSAFNRVERRVREYYNTTIDSSNEVAIRTPMTARSRFASSTNYTRQAASQGSRLDGDDKPWRGVGASGDGGSVPSA